MNSFFQSMFAEQIDSAMHYAHWVAGIAVALCATYTALVTAGFFVPKMRSLMALFNKVFALVIVVLIGGGAAFLFYVTPKTQVVHVPTPVFEAPNIRLPDVDVDLELPDVPFDEIAESAGEAIDAMAEAASDLVSEMGDSLVPDPPTAEELAALKEQHRKAQYHRMVQQALNTSHQRLLSAANSFGGGYYSAFGAQAWSTNFSNQSRSRTRSANLERQSKANLDRVVNQFAIIEEDLILAVQRAAEQTSHSVYIDNLSSDSNGSVKRRIDDCKDEAWRLANQRRSKLSRINKRSIHNQIGQWRSEFMRQELGSLVAEIREEWASCLTFRCGVELR